MPVTSPLATVPGKKKKLNSPDNLRDIFFNVIESLYEQAKTLTMTL